MDEARAVLERIRRIDALGRERAGPAALLAELERLVLEARPLLDIEDGDESLAATGCARARRSERGRR